MVRDKAGSCCRQGGKTDNADHTHSEICIFWTELVPYAIRFEDLRAERQARAKRLEELKALRDEEEE